MHLSAAAPRGEGADGVTVVKVELHSHSADDPVDYIPHSTCELIERAAQLGYNALAITLHDRQIDLQPFADLARQRRQHQAHYLTVRRA